MSALDPRPRLASWSRDATARVVVGLVVVAAIALRIWILVSPIGRADGDEAVVGLMARGMLHGRRPIFFWGQSYGGTLEAALVAAVFRVAGTSTAALKAVPLVLCGLAAALVYRIARRVLPTPSAAFAGVLFLVYPPAFIWWSTKERGFYWFGLVCTLLGLLLVLRMLAAQPRPSPRDAVFLGLVVGLGWWTTPQTMFVLVPVVAFLVVRRRGDLATLAWALPAAAIGAAPWLRWNLTNDFRSLQQPHAAVASTYGDRLDLFFTRLLPMALGVRAPFTGRWLLTPFVGVALYLGALAVFAWVAVAAFRSASGPLRVLVVAAAVYPVLFAVPSTSYFVGEPRYALMLAPLIVLFVAYLTRTQAAQVCVMVLALALAVGTVRTTMQVAAANPFSADLDPPRYAGLIEVLRHSHVDRVYADYWIAYGLTFATKESIVGSPVDVVRSPDLAAKVAAAPRSVYVLFRGRARDRALHAALDARRLPYEHRDVDRFSVYALRGRVAPQTFVSVWRLPSP